MSTVFLGKLPAITEMRIDIVRSLRLQLMATPSRFEQNLAPLGEYLRKTRESRNLTQDGLEKVTAAKGMRVSSQNIQQYETGKTKSPSLFVLVVLASALERPTREVIDMALGVPPEETNAFKKSEFGALFDSYQHLPLAEQRIQKRYLQMLERENTRIFMQQENDSQK